jgi:hypothetical protein
VTRSVEYERHNVQQAYLIDEDEIVQVLEVKLKKKKKSSLEDPFKVNKSQLKRAYRALRENLK